MSADKGAMPATEDIPEIPRHPLIVTPEDNYTRGECDLRYVNSEHPAVWRSNTRYAIVRCGVCGHDSADTAGMEVAAWEGHDIHWSVCHVGRQTVRITFDVELRGDLDNREAIEAAASIVDPESRMAEFAYGTVASRYPPGQPYPGSPEEDIEQRAFRTKHQAKSRADNITTGGGIDAE